MNNFGQAIEALKAGKKVFRSGWNSHNTWLFLVPANSILLIQTETAILNEQQLAPWIAMKTANGPIVPWVASHYDMLAENWEVMQ